MEWHNLCHLLCRTFHVLIAPHVSKMPMTKSFLSPNCRLLAQQTSAKRPIVDFINLILLIVLPICQAQFITTTAVSTFTSPDPHNYQGQYVGQNGRSESHVNMCPNSQTIGEQLLTRSCNSAVQSQPSTAAGAAHSPRQAAGPNAARPRQGGRRRPRRATWRRFAARGRIPTGTGRLGHAPTAQTASAERSSRRFPGPASNGRGTCALGPGVVMMSRRYIGGWMWRSL